MSRTFGGTANLKVVIYGVSYAERSDKRSLSARNIGGKAVETGEPSDDGTRPTSPARYSCDAANTLSDLGTWSKLLNTKEELFDGRHERPA
jgi:hypothetical protein